ncbi:MAG: hypothetical protein M2R45_05284 [Verrucomicrobia subdivision 3 bacterium]|nr:hypothetical protein [Limisphaerales bacterium]MCS1417482.1 hypothetical protein [Limisphaerales bacterium]
MANLQQRKEWQECYRLPPTAGVVTHVICFWDSYLDRNTNVWHCVALNRGKLRRWNYDNLPHRENWAGQHPEDWTNIASADEE